MSKKFIYLSHLQKICCATFNAIVTKYTNNDDKWYFYTKILWHKILIARIVLATKILSDEFDLQEPASL